VKLAQDHAQWQALLLEVLNRRIPLAGLVYDICDRLPALNENFREESAIEGMVW
jgi:hypothetical protein